MLLLTVLIGIAPLFWMLFRFVIKRRVVVGRDIRETDGLMSRIVKALMGGMSPAGDPTDNLATVFAAGRSMPRQTGTETVFQATSGWRYGFLATVAFVGYFTLHFEGQSGMGGQTGLGMYALMGAVLLYGGAYIWGFRLTIDGVHMRCMNGLFVMRDYDLTQMISARKTKDNYTLTFADGRKAKVPFFLEGQGVLIDFLIAELEANGH